MLVGAGGGERIYWVASACRGRATFRLCARARLGRCRRAKQRYRRRLHYDSGLDEHRDNDIRRQYIQHCGGREPAKCGRRLQRREQQRQCLRSGVGCCKQWLHCYWRYQ